MIVSAPPSIGDLIDKISILLIKKNNIKDLKKLSHIKLELEKLNKVLKKTKIKQKLIKTYLDKMRRINLKLWLIEDEIRLCEKNKNFKKKFISLARSVYLNNDIRARIKLEINTKFNSGILEIKSYKKY